MQLRFIITLRCLWCHVRACLPIIPLWWWEKAASRKHVDLEREPGGSGGPGWPARGWGLASVSLESTMRCTDQLYRLFAHSARKQVCLLMWPSVTEERGRDAWGVGGCCTHMQHGVTNTKNSQCIHGALSSPKPRTKIYMHMQDLYIYTIFVFICVHIGALCAYGAQQYMVEFACGTIYPPSVNQYAVTVISSSS